MIPYDGTLCISQYTYKFYCRVIHKVASGVHEEKDYLLATAYDGQHTLGFTFDLYHAYCTQAKVSKIINLVS